MPDRPTSRDGILRPSSFGSRPGSRSSGALPHVFIYSTRLSHSALLRWARSAAVVPRKRHDR